MMTFTKHGIASERCMMEDGQALIALHSFVFSFWFSTACLQGFFYSIYPQRFDHIQYKVQSTKTLNTTISNHLSPLTNTVKCNRKSKAVHTSARSSPQYRKQTAVSINTLRLLSCFRIGVRIQIARRIPTWPRSLSTCCSAR